MAKKKESKKSGRDWNKFVSELTVDDLIALHGAMSEYVDVIRCLGDC